MTALAVGILLICASAAGWVLIALVAVDVLRYRSAGHPRPARTTHDGDRP